MKYNVHVYFTCRAKVEDVEADSPGAAAIKASMNFPGDDVVRSEELNITDMAGHRITAVDYAEEETGYLVDEQGDEDYERSVCLNADFAPIKPEECKR